MWTTCCSDCCLSHYSHSHNMYLLVWTSEQNGHLLYAPTLYLRRHYEVSMETADG